MNATKGSRECTVVDGLGDMSRRRLLGTALGVTLVKLDASHVASLATMKAEGMSHAQIATLNALIARVRFIGVK